MCPGPPRGPSWLRRCPQGPVPIGPRWYISLHLTADAGAPRGRQRPPVSVSGTARAASGFEVVVRLRAGARRGAVDPVAALLALRLAGRTRRRPGPGRSAAAAAAASTGGGNGSGCASVWRLDVRAGCRRAGSRQGPPPGSRTSPPVCTRWGLPGVSSSGGARPAAGPCLRPQLTLTASRHQHSGGWGSTWAPGGHRHSVPRGPGNDVGSTEEPAGERVRALGLEPGEPLSWLGGDRPRGRQRAPPRSGLGHRAPSGGRGSRASFNTHGSCPGRPPRPGAPTPRAECDETSPRVTGPHTALELGRVCPSEMRTLDP